MAEEVPSSDGPSKETGPKTMSAPAGAKDASAKPSSADASPDAASSDAASRKGAARHHDARDAAVLDKDQDDDAGATFDNTRQHVVDRQKPDEVEQRFANTRHNIALINDPKNGPRFTLTKRESGLAEPADKARERSPAADKDAAGEDDAARPRGSEFISAAEPAAEAVAAPPDAASVIEPEPERKSEPEAKAPPSRPTRPRGVPPAAEPPSKAPVDSSKTFVGPNGTYYDESWRWMDWRGSKRSWNWAAAATFGHWFAFRRLYRHAGLYVIWLAALAAALVNNGHAGLVAGLLILTPVLTGIYANILYFQVFRRAVAHVTEKGEGGYDELKAQLARAGGVRPKAVWVMAGLTILAIAAVLLTTYALRGGFQFNVWPLEEFL